MCIILSLFARLKVFIACSAHSNRVNVTKLLYRHKVVRTVITEASSTVAAMVNTTNKQPKFSFAVTAVYRQMVRNPSRRFTNRLLIRLFAN